MPTPGPLELIIILVIALLILGPGKLPDVGAALGKSIREFRKASSDVQDAVKVDTSPMPAAPTAPEAAPAAPATSPMAQATPAAAAAERTTAEPGEERVAEPGVAPTASDLPGAPTVAAAPATSPASSEPTPGND
jgi:TatA/E family protein of Tat protein translocase